MSETVQNLKNIVLKGIEVIGNKANDLASSTRQKMDLMNLESKKKDLIISLGKKVMELSQQGTLFPDEIEDLLNDITETETEINNLLSDETKNKNKEANAPAENASSDAAGQIAETENNEPVAAEYAARDDSDVPVIEVDEEEDSSDGNDCPLSSSINDLFEKVPPMEKMMDKVNSSLDELGENLLKFSGDFDKSLNDFADQMMGNDRKNPDQ